MSASDVRTARLARPTQRSGETTVGARPARRGREAPLVLGRYRLHRRLGTGGFGSVWMAADERLGRDVAVKILHRERVVGGRFEREALAAARLAHPGIVTLYEAAVDDDGAYLVSELVRGHTMGQLLEAGRLSDRDVVEIAIALCDALAHAHAQGIVHRDVKPSNILIPDHPASPAQVAKLTDFGVARVIGGDTLTRTGDVIGTAAYMAPEQAEGREAAAPADLYALALVVYEALTGVNPVRTTTAAQRARRLGAHLPPLRRQRRELPRELGCAIDLALRPKPRERGTLEELRAAMIESLPATADRPGVVTSAWPGGVTRDRRTRDEEADHWRDPAARGYAPAGGYVPAGYAPAGSAPAARHAPDRDAGAAGSGAGDTDDADLKDAARPFAWPDRALAAAAAAMTAGWLSVHLLASPPLAPAAIALVAALATAVLPRVGWVVTTIALATAAIAQGRPAGAMLLVAAVAVPIVLIPWRGTDWPLAAAAPALGLFGLAGAWPAIAARVAGPWRRAALGAAGWIWLVLATPIRGRTLYLTLSTGHLNGPLHAVLEPVISSSALLGAPVWAAGAVVLPWLVRGRSLAVHVTLVTIWSATLVSATGAALDVVHSPGGPLGLTGTVTGAVAGALVALAPGVIAAARVARGQAGVP